MSVSKNLANALLIYQQPYQVRENTCSVDVQDLLDKYRLLQIDFQKIQTILSEEQANRKVSDERRSNCDNELTSSNSASSRCQEEKSTVGTNLQTCEFNKNNEVRIQYLQDQNILDDTVRQKNTEVGDWITIAMSGWGFFFGTIIIVGALLVLRKKQREVLP